MRAWMCVVVLAGCAIDVNHRPLGPNQYIVEAEGQNRHSHADVLEAAHQRAAEICGVGRYQLFDNQSSQRNGAFVDGYGNVQGTRKLSVVLMIQCQVTQACTGAPGGC